MKWAIGIDACPTGDLGWTSSGMSQLLDGDAFKMIQIQFMSLNNINLLNQLIQYLISLLLRQQFKMSQFQRVIGLYLNNDVVVGSRMYKNGGMIDLDLGYDECYTKFCYCNCLNTVKL